MQTMVTQAGQSVMSIATAILIARALGPAGQGTYATIVAGVAIGALLAALGQSQGNVLAAAGNIAARPLVAAAILHSIVLAAVLVLTSGLWHAAFGVEAGSALAYLVGLVLALEMLSQMLRGVNLGRHQVTAFNLSAFAQRFSMLLAVAALLAMSGLTVGRVISAWAMSALVSIVLSIFWIWRSTDAIALDARAIGSSWRQAFRHGGRALVVLAMTLLLVRSDIWLLRYLTDEPTVGQMSVALGLAEWLWYVPGMLNNLLFAAVAADRGGETTRQVLRATRLVAALSIPAAVVLVLVGAFVVRLLYGPAYAPAGTLFVLLVPGMTAIAIHLVLDSYFAGRGFPPISQWAVALTLALKVMLTILAVPKWGAEGAAVVTSIAYAVLLGIKVIGIRQSAAVALRDILIASRDDIDRGSRELRDWLTVRLRRSEV